MAMQRCRRKAPRNIGILPQKAFLPLVRYGDHLLPLGDQAADQPRHGQLLFATSSKNRSTFSNLKGLGLHKPKQHLRFEGTGQLKQEKDIQQLYVLDAFRRLYAQPVAREQLALTT